MKKIVFSLMTLFALALMAGSAMGQNEKLVLAGGTYTYHLDGVESFYDATATVFYNGGGETISQIGTSWDITGGTTSTVSFTVKYGTQNIPAGSGQIKVVITDDNSGCTNEILLTIAVSSPTYTLALTKDVATSNYIECQARTGAGDNTADALGDDLGGEVNTFTFTVTPEITGITGVFDYSYTINFPDDIAGLNSYTIKDALNVDVTTGTISYIDVTSVSTDVFTVTFNTTTGIATKTLTSLLTLSTSLLKPDDGGGTYVATSGGDLTQSVNVNAVPTIGGFN